jgi:hypothetical protein
MLYYPKNRSTQEYREKSHDFYATPANVTEALLKVEDFPGKVWEPCCGQGHISKVLKTHGLDVYSTDLRTDLGYGDETGLDFLDAVRDCDCVLTNPPYRNNLNLYCAAHALYVARKKVALLLPLHFLETPRRRRFLREHPPRTIWVFEYRVHTLKEGFVGTPASRMIFSWFVWERGYTGKTSIDWLTK